jgi:two-component system, LuxR family, response regulator FixJ
MPEGVTMRCLMFAEERAETTETLASLLGECGLGVTLCAEQEDWLGSLGAHRWQTLVIDASRESHGVTGLLAQSRQACPETPVLILVRQGDTATAVRAVKAGAANCIEIPITPARRHAVRDILCGQTDHALQDLWACLTPVEQTVLRHVLSSRTNRQIAELLKRSPRTIEVHRRHIMEKLDAGNLVELVKQAYAYQRWP